MNENNPIESFDENGYYSIRSSGSEEPISDLCPPKAGTSPYAEMPSISQFAPSPAQSSLNSESVTSAAPPPSEKKAKKKKGLGAAMVAVGLCCGLLGSILGGFVVGYFTLDTQWKVNRSESESAHSGSDLNASNAQPQATVPSAPISSSTTGLTPAEVYAANVDAVVGITNEYTASYGFGQTSKATSTGSGFIISPDGEILTNYHVVQGAEALTVTLYDGTEYKAEVLGYEAAGDVALIKIDGEDLPTVTIGDSSSLYVGAEVAAIGNPLGELTYSLNVGYVSATKRTVNTDGTLISMMQLDVSINSGNSGGPLFDMNGNVVGITSAKYSGTSGGGATIEGIGFAIPIDDVELILDDLRENGAVLDRAYMGIKASSITDAEARRFNLPLGAYVESVDEGGSADKAGLEAGDIITAVDDTALNGYEDLSGVLREYRAGDTATLKVYRSGKIIELEITFDAKPVSE